MLIFMFAVGIVDKAGVSQFCLYEVVLLAFLFRCLVVSPKTRFLCGLTAMLTLSWIPVFWEINLGLFLLKSAANDDPMTGMVEHEPMETWFWQF